MFSIFGIEVVKKVKNKELLNIVLTLVMRSNWHSSKGNAPLKSVKILARNYLAIFSDEWQKKGFRIMPLNAVFVWLIIIN